jgi:small multidrug resistance pump
MHWIMLYAAIALEVAGTTALKLSAGLTRPSFFAGALLLYGVSFFLLALSLRTLPISVAYAIWSGLGTVLVAAIGLAVFKEPVTALRVLFFTLIVVGCVGLNLVTEAVPRSASH